MVGNWLGRRELPHGARLLATAHGVAASADAFVAVSLAGSLFFSISPEASRQQVLLYLVVNLVPFTLLAPLVGPAIDRFRGSRRVIVTTLFASRAALAVGLAIAIDDLAFYFFALALLIFGKGSGVTRQALMPTLVDSPDQFVAANSMVARITLITGSGGGALAAGVLVATSPLVTLAFACVGFLAAAGLATRLPPGVGREQPEELAAEAEFLQLHAPAVAATAWAFTLIRVAVGFFTFGITFALRRESEPAFMYGAAAGMWAAGTFAGNALAPALRRRTSEERLTAGSLIGLAVAASFGALGPSRLLVLTVATVLGLAASIGRQGFDALVQRRSPHTRRGSAFARFETRFQLGWVGGAIGATAVAVPIQVGMGVVALGLVPAALIYLRNIAEVREADTEDPTQPVVLVRRRLERLTDAEHRLHPRIVAVELASATDLLRAIDRPVDGALAARIDLLRRAVFNGRDPDVIELDTTLRDTLAAVAALDAKPPVWASATADDPTASPRLEGDE